MTRLPILGLGVFASLLLALASPAAAQTTWAVASQPELLAALSGASSGDTIRLTANITLTADLPAVQTDLTIDGSGHTLSGNGQYRGLIIGDLSVVAAPLPVSVSILNLTLANTVASGGAGASSFDGGGGGGGGLGGAIFVADQATVALSGVSVTGAGAVGGSGGAASGVPGPGIGGSGTGQVGVGGFGGSAATSGGYGGGGGGTLIGNFAGGSAFAGGAGSMIGGGGGGAGLGGAIFVQTGGALTVTGPLSVNGNSVTGGAGGPGAGNGAAYGGGVFLGGFGTITFAPPSGASVSVGDTIADAEGASGIPGAGSWGLVKDGAGTLILSGANQYSGGTCVDAGTLSVTSDANLGTPGSSLGLSGTSTLAITGSNTFARDLILDGSPSLAVASGTSANWAGSILDSEMPAALVVTGGGTLRLSNPQNLFSNGLTIAGNTTVEFASEGALGAPGQGVQLGNASSAGTLRLIGWNRELGSQLHARRYRRGHVRRDGGRTALTRRSGQRFGRARKGRRRNARACGRERLHRWHPGCGRHAAGRRG